MALNYLRTFFRAVLFLLFLVSIHHRWGTQTVLAQQAEWLPAEDPAYHLIQALQDRGFLSALNPTLRPYTKAQLRQALSKLDKASLHELERSWVDQLEQVLSADRVGKDSIQTHVRSTSHLKGSTSGRYDVMRPLSSTPHVDPGQQLHLGFSSSSWTASMGFTYDLFYYRDPDGLDVVKRFMSRGEDTYLGYHSRFVEVHLGRFGSHWNVFGLEAPLIGNDVRQYDQLHLRIGTERFSLRSIYGELDNLDSLGAYQGRGFRTGSKRRFVFAHRIDWRPNPHWTLTYFEGELISASHAGISLEYLQPFHLTFIEGDNSPKNFENNIMLGAGIDYRKHRFQFTAQGILDDMVIFHRKTAKAEGRFEPATGQLSFQVKQSAITPRLDLGVQGVLISALSYQTDQLEGQWTYAQRSLATENNDYVYLKLFADWHPPVAISGWSLQPHYAFLAQGSGNYRNPFDKTYQSGRMLPAVLSGKETITHRVALASNWLMTPPSSTRRYIHPRFSLFAKTNLGFNYIASQKQMDFQGNAMIMMKVRL